jgi:3-dehydroquinate dehydratase-2
VKILVIHGPNLNLLGQREPETYGVITLEQINNELSDLAQKNNIEIEFFQSNIEGELVTKIQEAGLKNFSGVIINPAAYTHTSVAIRDAISAIKTPVIEVHISNVYKREDFRHKSLTVSVCKGQICGFGAQSYKLALQAFLNE